MDYLFIGEQSERPSDKLGGTFFIPRARLYVCHYIRECSSTLYEGLARAVPPTNTNFRLTFLQIWLQEALYEDLPV